MLRFELSVRAGLSSLLVRSEPSIVGMSAQPGTIDADFQSVPGTSPAVITSDLAVESGYRKIRLTEWVFGSNRRR
jgi:hypothetical protein